MINETVRILSSHQKAKIALIESLFEDTYFHWHQNDTSSSVFANINSRMRLKIRSNGKASFEFNAIPAERVDQRSNIERNGTG